MAVKSKSWYVTVFNGAKTEFSKQCLSKQEANVLLAEKKEEYAGKGYSILQENY